jgi:Zn-dependent protease with chaperone function
MSQNRLIDICSILFSGLIWSLFPNDTAAGLTQLLMEDLFKICFELPYSRFCETEADEFGLLLTARVNHLHKFFLFKSSL